MLRQCFQAMVAVISAAMVTGCVASGTQGGSDVKPGKKPAALEDGYYVRIYDDGSASVAMGPDILDDDWSIDCRVDAMTDKRNCSISADLGNVFVHYGSAATPHTVCIFGHDYPGRRGQIRVGRGTPITTNESGCVAAATVLAQLRVADEVTTRRYRWPYDYNVDATFSLRGFNKAMEIVNRIREGAAVSTQ